jgi:hypothetical protein
MRTFFVSKPAEGFPSHHLMPMGNRKHGRGRHPLANAGGEQTERLLEERVLHL